MKTAIWCVIGLLVLTVIPGRTTAQGIEAVGLCNECQTCFEELCSWGIGHSFNVPGDPDYWMIGDHEECGCGTCAYYHLSCVGDDAQTDAVVQAFQTALFAGGDFANAVMSNARFAVIDEARMRLIVLECGRPVANYRITKGQIATAQRVIQSILQ